MPPKNLAFDRVRERHPFKSLFFFLLFAVCMAVVVYRVLGYFSEYPFEGRVEGPEVEVSATSRGRIDRITVQTNDIVEKGQVLVELSDETLATEIQNMRTEIDRVQEALEKARSEETLQDRLFVIHEKIAETEVEIELLDLALEGALREIEAASAETAFLTDQLARLEKLYQAKALVLSEVEGKRFSVEQKRQALIALRDDLRQKEKQKELYQDLIAMFQEREKNIREEFNKDVTDLEIQLAKNQSDLNTLLAQQKELTLTAPTDGIVSKVMKAPGETASAGNPILRISTGDDIWVDTYLNSERVTQIVEGDRVQVQLKSDKTVRFPGKVKSISPIMQSQPGYNPGPFEETTERVAIARVDFDNPRDARRFVRPGQRVTVILISEEAKNPFGRQVDARPAEPDSQP